MIEWAEFRNQLTKIKNKTNFDLYLQVLLFF